MNVREVKQPVSGFSNKPQAMAVYKKPIAVPVFGQTPSETAKPPIRYKKPLWYYFFLGRDHIARSPILPDLKSIPKTIQAFSQTQFLNARGQLIEGRAILKHFIQNRGEYDETWGPVGYRYGKEGQTHGGRFAIAARYSCMYSYALDAEFGFNTPKTLSPMVSLLFQLNILQTREEVHDNGIFVDSKTLTSLSPKALYAFSD